MTQFTGKDLDEDTGLYYYNARWYDQEVGRFISEDPGNDPNNPNLYSYVANDPLTRTDPSGENLFDWAKEQLKKNVVSWLHSPAGDTDPQKLLEKRKQGFYGFLYDYCNEMMFGVNVSDLYDKMVKENKINPDKYSREQFANDIGPILEYKYATSTTNGQSITDNATFYASIWMAAQCLASLKPGALTESAEKDGIAVTAEGTVFTESGLSSIESGIIATERQLMAEESGIINTNRVFWSGGDTAKNAAEAWAKANNATTLEMSLEQTGNDMATITKNMEWNEAKPLWETVSSKFAQNAKGEVNVFVKAQGPSSGSIWNTVEYKQILSNTNVSRIRFNVIMPDGRIQSYVEALR